MFVLDVAKGLKTSAADAVVQHLLGLLPPRVERGDADRMDLVRLLKSLKGRAAFEAVLPVVKTRLTTALTEFEEFRSIAMFVEEFPSTVTDEELAPVRESFTKCATDWASGTEDLAAALRETADDIEHIGGQLGVDTAEIVEPLVEHARELEGEEQQQLEDEDDSGASYSHGASSVDSVFDMFRDLADEIRERRP